MNDWKEIISFIQPHEAHIANSFLKNQGIETSIKDEMIAQIINPLSNNMGGVKIFVPMHQADLARKILIEGGYLND
jgi:hypothetical protein